MIQTSDLHHAKTQQNVKNVLSSTLFIYQDQIEGDFYISENDSEEKELANGDKKQIAICESCASQNEILLSSGTVISKGKEYQLCEGCTEYYNSATETEVENWLGSL